MEINRFILIVFVGAKVGKITSTYVFPYEFLYMLRIFLRIVLVGHGMCGTRNNPQLFRFRLGFVKRVDHPCRHIGVRIAVYKEHGQGTLPDLLQSRSFTEIPSILLLAKPACHMQQRESGQAVLCFQFAPEFIPYAGIAAVLNETFDERLLVMIVYLLGVRIGDTHYADVYFDGHVVRREGVFSFLPTIC